MQRALLACTLHAIASASVARSAGTAVLGRQTYEPVPHKCTAHATSRLGCLEAGCTFLELANENRCMPCEMDGIDWPCPSVGSVYAMQEVKACSMACTHQKTVQKLSPCEDVSGDITLAQCFAKGSSALTKCMWTQYNDKHGKLKSVCGPCSMEGVGRIPSVSTGMVGPEGPGSLAVMCFSQCEDDCPQPMLPGCTPTAAPAPFPPTPQPPETLNLHFSDDAPDYVTVLVPKPYGKHEWEMAARAGAQTALWGPDTVQPPSAPISIYGPPPPEGPTLPPGMPVMFGPAPPGLVGAPPPGYGYGTQPPPAMVDFAKGQSLLEAGHRSRLRRGRK